MSVATKSMAIVDTNGNRIGNKLVSVDAFETLTYDRSDYGMTTYYATGKTGTNNASGLEVKEYASVEDSRLWVNLEFKMIFEG